MLGALPSLCSMFLLLLFLLLLRLMFLFRASLPFSGYLSDCVELCVLCCVTVSNKLFVKFTSMSPISEVLDPGGAQKEVTEGLRLGYSWYMHSS